MIGSNIGVVIRTAAQLKKMQPELVDALKRAIGTDKPIPVVYQYLHRPNEQLIVDSDNTIGKVTNIRFNNDGDIVGDFEILSILKIASNFQGIVDNMAASIDTSSSYSSKPKFKIDAFIIYDRIAKEEVLRRKKTIMDSSFPSRLARPGEIPFMPSGDESGVIKEATEKLIKEFEKQVAEQPDKEE